MLFNAFGQKQNKNYKKIDIFLTFSKMLNKTKP